MLSLRVAGIGRRLHAAQRCISLSLLGAREAHKRTSAQAHKRPLLLVARPLAFEHSRAQCCACIFFCASVHLCIACTRVVHTCLCACVLIFVRTFVLVHSRPRALCIWRPPIRTHHYACTLMHSVVAYIRTPFGTCALSARRMLGSFVLGPQCSRACALSLSWRSCTLDPSLVVCLRMFALSFYFTLRAAPHSTLVQVAVLVYCQ
jgi:hypothetical protein